MKTARFPIRSLLVPCCLLLGGALSSCGKDGDARSAVTGQAGAGAGKTPSEGAAKDGEKPKSAEKPKGGSSAALAHQIALQHLGKGDLEKGEAELERAIGIDPEMSEAHFELGRLKLQLATQKSWTQSIDLELLGEGIAALTKAVELEPENPQYRLHLGRGYYQRDELDQALVHLKKAVELEPKLVAGWKTLGAAQLDSAEPEAARDSFQRALEVQPADPGAHYSLAQALEVLGDLPGARVELEKSLELDPSVYEVHGRLAQLCNSLGDVEGEAKAREGMQRWFEHDQLLQQARKKMKEDPKDAAAVREMGELYAGIGDWPRAAEFLFRASQMGDRRDWRAHLGCGIARRHLKDYVYAGHHLKEAEFLAPDVLDPKLELVRLYAELGDDPSLNKLVEKFEDESPDGASLWFMAEVCQEVGRAEHATRLFEKAKAAGVTEAPTEWVLAEDAVPRDAGPQDAAPKDAPSAKKNE